MPLQKITKSQRKREQQKENKEVINSQKTIRKMAIRTYLSIITSNVNRL